MFSKLVKSAAVMVLALTLGVSSAWASGKMQVKIGDRVDLVADSADPGATFKWIVKKSDEILSTQSIRNFSFIFPAQGEYQVNLTATSGRNVESTTLLVLAGDLYEKARPGEGEVVLGGGAPLKLLIETLPSLTSEKRVHLLGDSGKVSFILNKSIGDILEYRIDRNIFEDSDGNGVSNDDIDNSSDNSYLTGQPWVTDYKAGEAAKIVAEVTLVDKAGKKAKGQAEIVFDALDQTGDPLAVLDTSPEADSRDNLVHLYNDPHKVVFYARKSKGKIVEYRIDRDIFTDSDGNGNPADDIDNLNDPSFKTGDVWETDYAKTDKQIIAQLIVVGAAGKGSRVQKGLVFGNKPTPALTEIQGGIRLTADKEFVLKSDPIQFTVQGLELGLDQYTFSWDFNGDGTYDQDIDANNTVQFIYDTPGVYTVKVRITDKNGNTVDKTLEIVVKDAVVTKADFSFEQNGNTLRFTDLSTVSPNLADKTLNYAWSFGDTDPAGYEKQKDQIGLQSPTYTYSKAGKYIVTLTVTDADQVTDSRVAEITVDKDLAAAPETVSTPAETTAGAGRFIPLVFKILKVIFYLILIAVAIALLAVGGVLVFFKIKQPGLTFEELVDELKNKILKMIGTQDFEEGPHKSSGYPQMPTGPALSAEASAVEVTLETPATEAPKDNVIEGEVEESKKDDSDKTPPPVNEQGPTPDWLKGVK